MDDSLSLANLGTHIVGRRIIYLPEVASTMDAARKDAIEGAEEGTVVIAGRQIGGRGRAGRSWLSPEGSIALSVVLRPELNQLPSLIMIASLAVAATIESTGVGCGIKWPNDILVKGKKISGILIENSVRGDRVEWAVIGIGLNVNVKPAAHPEIASLATSLSAEMGEEIPVEGITRRLLLELDRCYLALRRGEDIFGEWRRRLVTLGKRVRAETSRGMLEGVAEEVEDDGRLRLRRPDGTLTLISAGDVLLREA